MPICPNCRTGYDNLANCPKCDSPAPKHKTPRNPGVTTYNCSRFGIFCIFSAWIGTIFSLILLIYKSYNEVSSLMEGLTSWLSILTHVGICYALWMALNYATNKKD